MIKREEVPALLQEYTEGENVYVSVDKQRKRTYLYTYLKFGDYTFKETLRFLDEPYKINILITVTVVEEPGTIISKNLTTKNNWDEVTTFLCKAEETLVRHYLKLQKLNEFKAEE